MVAHADREQFQAETAEQWRAWLVERAEGSDGVWLVTWKKSSGRPHLPYADAVTEALAVGWVDSVGRAVDDERSGLWFAPRNPRSGWSRPNKERVARLEAEGRMLPAGARAVAVAKASGAWSLLDDVEALREPPDLARALDAVPAARGHWDAFPRSAKRGILEWVAQAKRDETRARRVAETVERAAVGERANQWRQPGGRT